MKWYVEVVSYAKNRLGHEVIVKRLKSSYKKQAERAEIGLNQQLNHDLYYTRIVSEE